jgi:DNA-binding response OmpR family regulator/KaiC/GvpD/RAD55 family RecA-like ATPase
MTAAPQVPLLERALGDFVPGHPYLIHGQPGVGKTILGLQVSHAWTQAGLRVVYLTREKGDDLLEQASLLGLSLESAWQDGRFVLLSGAPRLSQQVSDLGLETFLEQLHGHAGDDSTLLVIDPATILFADLRGSHVARALGQLLGRLREWGWTVLLLGRTGKLRPHGLLDALSERCWGVIELQRARVSRDAGESPFAVKVLKSHLTAPVGTVVPYTIALEAGLVAAPETLETGTPEGIDASPRRPRALIACAERDPLEPLIGMLRYAMDLEVVCDGVTALSRAATWQPDVVVLQSDMPRLSGLSVTRALRQGGYGMAIVVLSYGERRRSDRVRALLCGATDFVECPFDLQETAFRIRLASRVRVDAPHAIAEEHRLESLIEKGRQAVVDTPEFLEVLGLALRRGARFSTPVSLVAFAFDETGASPREMSLWSRFRGVLSRSVRAGDLVCFPTPQRAATLLCHETRSGARAFSERVSERVAREFGSAAMQVLSGRLMTGRWTLAGVLPEGGNLAELVDSAFEQARPVVEAGGDPPLAATGTDGP